MHDRVTSSESPVGRGLSGRWGFGVLIALSLALCPRVEAAERQPPMVFKTLAQDAGLTQNTVNAVYQDSLGFIWIATQNGLNRYVGHEIQAFLRDPVSPGGLRNDFLRDIDEDSRGDLWLASSGSGVIRFRRRSGHFENLWSAEELDRHPGRADVRSVKVARDGSVWLGTRGGGLLQLDADGSLQRTYRTESDPGLLSDDINDIVEQDDGTLWVATNGGVSRRDAGTGELEPVDVLGQGSEATVLALGKAGTLWVGYREQGLARFDPATGSVRRWQVEREGSGHLSHNRVLSVLEDSAGRLWVATQDGLNLLMPGHEELQVYRHDPVNPFSFPDNYLMSLYEDRSGLLWFGTRTRGVAIWNPRSWSFGAYRRPWHADAIINAFATDDGGVWVGTIGQGLVHLDASGEIDRRYRPADGMPALTDERVMSLLLDRRGDLWIGTVTGGLHRYRQKTGEQTVFRHEPGNTASLGADGIMTVRELSDGYVWAGTFGGGLARIDPVDGTVSRFEHDPADPNSLSANRVTSLAETRDGRLWVGTDGGGLNALDRDTGRAVRIRTGTIGENVETIYSLAVDAQGRVWAGTAGSGLLMIGGEIIDGVPTMLRRWSTPEGLPSNVVYGVLVDADNRIWASTNGGLVRLDAESGAYREFHVSHGLQAEEFNFGAYHAGTDGRLYFGGTHGFNAFRPDEVVVGSKPAPLQITAVQVLGQPIESEVPHALLDRIELRHDQDVLTVEFAAMDFAAPEANLYSVKLEGFDAAWSRPSPLPFVTYTNLDPGRYRLLVRATNSDGVPSEAPRSLAIRVRAAPWASWWAILLYLSVLGALVWGFLRWRLSKLEQQAKLRQLAYFDRLTGLPNRELVLVRLAEQVKTAVNTGSACVCIAVRVSGLQKVSDSFGPTVVDEVLQTISSRLSQVVHGEKEISTHEIDLGRASSDTFAACTKLVSADASISALLMRLRSVFEEPVVWNQQNIRVSAGFGVAVGPEHSRDAVTLLGYAEGAADAANPLAPDAVSYYDSRHTDQAVKRFEIENELRAAIEADELELHFQPKFAASGALRGCEALLRWPHPVRGQIPPNEFIPIAEQAGMMDRVDAWVIDSACRSMRRWRDAGLILLPIAVNVSAISLRNADIAERLSSSCRRHGVPPTLIEVELTESAMIADLERGRQVLQAIKRAGHDLALDDFGTGFSSLTYLHRFPIAKVKVDRSFVDGMEHNPEQRAICSAVQALAAGLKLVSVAEGVETEAQRLALCEMGFDELQGFLLGRPVAELRYMDLLRAATAEPADAG